MLKNLFHKAWAFVKRDYIAESSYTFAFVFESLTSVFPVLSFFFIGRMFEASSTQSLVAYGGKYFPFAVVGLALSQYFMTALRQFGFTIRRSQMAGCLEAMMSTRTSAEVVVIFSALYSFLSKGIQIILIFICGALLMPGCFVNANYVSAFIIMTLTVVVFSALGILSAACIIELKKGDPIEWVFGSLSALLGGALFPVSVLPLWLQKVAAFLPITYSLDAMRLSLLKGYSIGMLQHQVIILAFMALILFPLSVYAFSAAIAKSRRDGSMMHY